VYGPDDFAIDHIVYRPTIVGIGSNQRFSVLEPQNDTDGTPRVLFEVVTRSHDTAGEATHRTTRNDIE
jgi:hypothetical protein